MREESCLRLSRDSILLFTQMIWVSVEMLARRAMMESLRLGEGGVLVAGEVNGGELPGGEVVEGLEAAVVE